MIQGSEPCCYAGPADAPPIECAEPIMFCVRTVGDMAEYYACEKHLADMIPGDGKDVLVRTLPTIEQVRGTHGANGAPIA